MRAGGIGALKPFLISIRHEAVQWGRSEGWNWVYVLKTVSAMLLAMWISMRFDLDQPGTAMVTVLIVMQPHTGMVLAKSLYRIAGTLAGLVASLVLLGLFAQEPELFILGLALWVGICTAGAAFYRNFKSYGFVLAGYTAALIGLPAVMQPQAFFTLAVTRLSEVTLGILCAGVISDIILPRRLSDVIMSSVRSRYTDFIVFVRASLAGTLGLQELESLRMRLVGSVISLEAIRSAATLEDPEVRARDRRLKKLNSDFMAASTTFRSFRQLMRRLTENSAPAGLALDILYESLGDTLVNMGEAPRSAKEARRAARQIAAFRAVLSRRVGEVRTTLSDVPDSQAMMDFDTAVELLFRFVRELHAYTVSYAALQDEKQEANTPDDISFASSTDPVVAFLTGGRAFVAILLVGTFWIAAGWTGGVNAVLFAAVVSALCASAPDPSRAAGQMICGFTAGFPAVSLFKFIVIPSLDGFMLLCAALVPVLTAGLYLCTRPKCDGIGTGFLVFFITMVAPSNSMQFNPVPFINDGIAMITGVAAAGVMFVTFMPVAGVWLNRRLNRQLRSRVIMACFNPLEGLIHRFESSTHDVLHKLASNRQGRDVQEDRQLMARVLPVIEIGRAVIHVRKDADSIRMSQSLSDCIHESILSISLLYKRPSEPKRAAAIGKVAHAIETVRLEAESESNGRLTRDVLHRMLTSLHLIRTSLLDENTVPATEEYGSSTVLTGGIPDAA